MDRKNILKQIKDLIKFSTDIKFKDAKLVDGETIVKVDGEEFEVGKLLQVVTPDGLIPAPAGEHTTDEGIKIYVDEAGIITEIETVKLADGEEKPAAEELIEEDMGYDGDEEKKKEEDMKEEEVKKEEVKKEEMKKKMYEMEERIKKVEKMMDEMLPVVKQASEFSSSVLTKLDTFVKDTPAEIQFTSLKSEYKEFVRDNKEKATTSLEGIRNIRKK